MRSLRIRELIGALLLLAAFGSAHALEPPPGKPLVRNYPMAEYGGHLINWWVGQGPDQRIYVGGGDGLVIFDGARWQAIESRNRNRIRVMEFDPEGRLWIGSTNEFGYYAPGADGALIYHSLSDRLPEEQRSFGEIRALYVIDGAVYLHAFRHLFAWRDGELDVFEARDNLFRTTVSHQGRFLVVIRDRLFDLTEFPDGDAELEPEPGWRMPEGPRLSFLSSWPDGRIVMGSVAEGLYWLSDQAPERLPSEYDFSEVWPYRVMPSPSGDMLVATRQGGLYHMGTDGRAIDHLSRRGGLASDTVNGMGLDHENGLWLALDGAIARVDLFGGLRVYDADFGLASTHALVRYDNEWLVGGGNGLGVLRKDGSDASSLQGIDVPFLQVFDVLPVEGGLLIAASDGVHFGSPDLDALSLSKYERLLSDPYAYELTPSRLRPVVYAELDSGLGLLEQTADGWRSLGMVDGVDQRANTVAEDDQGRVWVGTSSGLYYRLAWQGDELVLEAELDADDGVPEGYAWAFDLDGRLVLGTGQGGYRPVEPGAERIEPDPEFDNDRLGEPRGVYRLYRADGGRLVGGIGPGGSLWRGRLDDAGRFEWKGRWLAQLESAVNWFIGERGEHLWIGRHPGLLRLDWPPAETETAPSKLQVVRAGFPDAGQWLVAGPGVGGLAEALPANSGSLRFEYALGSYTAPDLTEYRARLDGLESDWSRWSDETRRDYTNLPGGDYAFRVQARNATGAVSESRPLTFSVLSPWYLTPLVWAAYGVIGLFLLMLAARFGQRARERHLLLRQKELSEEVASRTAEVRAQAREIRRESDARARFFANVSHELRTPLTLTRAPLQELAKQAGGQLDDASKQYLDVALRNSEAMQSLIGQILDLQRLEAGYMPLRLVRVDLSGIVHGIVDRFALQAKLRGIELDTEGIDEKVVAVCDQAHLDTMLGNLLSNAIKFTPDGGWVIVRLAIAGNRIALSVHDSGPGVESAYRDAIFERYRQGARTSESSPGTGIGLALVRELAELHGGSVRLDETDEPGACFILELPVNLEPTADTADEHQIDVAIPSPESGELEAPVLERLESEDVPCVLLVDDNAELREFLRLRLGRSYRILEAADGSQGLAAAREAVPDAIITDGLMPVMDGLAMTREIKADPELAFVPVLMLTSRAAPEDAVRGLEAGADDYLAKPFDSAELAARVAGLIASRRRLKARLEAGDRVPDERPESVFLAQVNRVLDDNLGEPGFTVLDWAQLMHMDRTTLYRRLKSETGQSPEDYLREKRLQAAERLLSERAGNVAEVAEAVGFASVSHFSRRFRARFDCTPAAYAKR